MSGLSAVRADGRHLSGAAWGSATLIGLALGVIYTLSPVTLWCTAGVAAIMWWARGGLSAWERRWVTGLLALAIAARVLAVAALFLTADPDRGSLMTVFGDEEYMQLRAWRLRNIWLGLPVSRETLIYAYEGTGWTSYIAVIAYLQYLLGPAPYGVHLFNVVLFAAAAVLLYRITRRSYGDVPALIGFGLLLFVPTLFIWSVSALKESLYVLCVAGVLVAALQIVRARTWPARMLALAGTAALSAMLGTLRPGGLIVAVGSVLGGYALALAMASRRVLVAAVLTVAVAGWIAANVPSVRGQFVAGVHLLARQHRGHVFSSGHAYKVLDERLYADTNPSFQMTGAEGARYLVRALGSYVLVPLPWTAASALELLFLPEYVIWLVLVLLAIAGLGIAARRDVVWTGLLAAHTAVAAVSVALSSGNVGTLVRHRSVVIPFMIWFSAVACVRLFTLRGQESASGAETA
jgi:hypothetical protein